jgi:hypothetical protein
MTHRLRFVTVLSAFALAGAAVVAAGGAEFRFDDPPSDSGSAPDITRTERS